MEVAIWAILACEIIRMILAVVHFVMIARAQSQNEELQKKACDEFTKAMNRPEVVTEAVKEYISQQSKSYDYSTLFKCEQCEYLDINVNKEPCDSCRGFSNFKPFQKENDQDGK